MKSAVNINDNYANFEYNDSMIVKEKVSVLHFAQKLRELFKNSSGILSTKEVKLNGIPRQYLWILKNGNEIQMIFRGVYALNDVFEDIRCMQ